MRAWVISSSASSTCLSRSAIRVSRSAICVCVLFLGGLELALGVGDLGLGVVELALDLLDLVGLLRALVFPVGRGREDHGGDAEEHEREGHDENHEDLADERHGPIPPIRVRRSVIASPDDVTSRTKGRCSGRSGPGEVAWLRGWRRTPRRDATYQG